MAENIEIAQISKDMRMSQKGFTLAEMLIALALIGVIAAMLIPKILESSGQRTNIAKARNLMSLVERAYYESAMDPEGSAQNQNLFNFIRPRVNGVPTVGGVAGGCSTNLPAQGGFDFSDGTSVTFYDDDIGTPAANVKSAGMVSICFDLKANSSTSAYGDDLFVGTFNYRNATTPVKFNWDNAAANSDPTVRVGTLINQ